MSKRPSTVDPIFALIAAHAKAADARRRASRSYRKLCDRLDHRRDQLELPRESRLTSEEPAMQIGRASPDPFTCVRTRHDIGKAIWKHTDPLFLVLDQRSKKALGKVEAAAVRALVRQLVAFQRAHRAKRKACGLTAKLTTLHNAESATSQALDALVKQKPTTAEGRAALAKYVSSDDSDGNARDLPWWAMKRFVENMA